MLTTDHKKLQLVVSIALIDNRDQILISKRPEKKFLSGYWEFPGGKVKRNETPENAIIREVKEELNVNINNKDDYQMLIEEISSDINGKKYFNPASF